MSDNSLNRANSPPTTIPIQTGIPSQRLSPAKPWEIQRGFSSPTLPLNPTQNLQQNNNTPTNNTNSNNNGTVNNNNNNTPTNNTNNNSQTALVGQQQMQRAGLNGTSPLYPSGSRFMDTYDSYGGGYGANSYGGGYGSYGSGYGGGGYGAGGYGAGYGANSYGGGYGSYGGGSYGGYGDYGGMYPPKDPNAPPTRYSWINDLEQMVHAFGRFSRLLEANYFAMHMSLGSFMRMTERFWALLDYFKLFKAFAVFPILYKIYRKLIGKPVPPEVASDKALTIATGKPIDFSDYDSFKTVVETTAGSTTELTTPQRGLWSWIILLVTLGFLISGGKSIFTKLMNRRNRTIMQSVDEMENAWPAWKNN